MLVLMDRPRTFSDGGTVDETDTAEENVDQDTLGGVESEADETPSENLESVSGPTDAADSNSDPVSDDEQVVALDLEYSVDGQTGADVAITELVDDITETLAEIEVELPETRDVMNIDQENVIGTLNTLSQQTQVNDVDDKFATAVAKFRVVKQTEQFPGSDECEQIRSRIVRIDTALATLTDTNEGVAQLIQSVTDLKEQLEEQD